MKASISLLLLISMVFGSCQMNSKPGYRGTIHDHGLVVSAHPEASEIGKQILLKGGNAMDAACAVEFALAVCYPAAGNIGGGGFWIVRSQNGEFSALDYREKAPLAASRDLFLDDQGNVIPGKSTNTIFASGVPGTVAGMAKAHERFGKLTWSEVVQPAIDLAFNGFPVTEGQAQGLNGIRRSLLERNSWRPAFFKERRWKAGDLLIQNDLGETLSRIRDFGRDGFYTGETAARILEQMEESGGFMSLEDLKNYEAVWREPIQGKYREYEFVSMPPPSSGGVALAQLLGIIEEFPIARYGFHSPKTVHLMVEAERLAYADRAEWLGDPDFFSVPVSDLLDENYLKVRALSIQPGKARPSADVSAMEKPEQESEETTHYSVVDQWGNAVSATTTLNGGYGSRIVVKGAGFLLNNEMDDFSSKPGFPNIYGLVGGEANAIEPGKRMLSSMTPTIVTQNDKLLMVVGSPGGSTIITSVFQIIVNVLDFGMGMQEAVDAGRFHHQCWPDKISMEKGALDSLAISKLSAWGHTIEERGSIGRVDAILVLPDGKLEAGADKRGDDTAKGH